LIHFITILYNMAVTTVTTKMTGAINYTVVTDTSADWPSVANSTYFYDKADKLVHYKDGSGTVLEIFAGGLTEFTEAENTAAPNATVPVNSLTPVTATANADFAIVPKGNGAFMLDIPDNTTAGGNKRGQYAVDLQHGPRANADKVASSDYSTIIGGRDNRAYNTYAIAGGYLAFAGGNQCTALQQASATNTLTFAHGQRTTASGFAAVAFGGYSYVDTIASGDNSVAIGAGNTSSAQFATTLGGIQNVASGVASYASGYQANTFTIYGRQSRGYSNTVSGDCQKSEWYLSKRTTDATPTTLTVGGGGVNPQAQLVLQNNNGYRFKGSIIGKQSGSVNVSAWDVDGLIVRGTTAASTSLVVGNINLVSNAPGWGTPTVTADTTNGLLLIQVTGLGATNIQWTCTLETTEVIYA
jgi:hypothetical protein